MTDYIKPRLIRIERWEKTEKLYKLEAILHKALDASVREWLKVNRLTEKDFWTIGIPQGLYDLLHGYDQSASKLAAEAFLEFHGYIVTKPKEVQDGELATQSKSETPVHGEGGS